MYKNSFDYAAKILTFTFLSMGCLISKPVFNIIYTKKNSNKLTENLFSNNSKAHKKIIINFLYTYFLLYINAG